MENIFNILKPNIFSIFSREDRRANYDLLSAIYDFYTKDTHTQNVPSDELVEFVTDYIKDENVRFLDDDNKEIDSKVPKEIAQRKVRQLKACGWLEEEPIGFTSYISLNDNAIILLDTFRSIVNSQDHPLEYSGYFYFIYNTLVEKFDIKKSKAIIEQVSKNTRELFNSLKGVSSAIKRFIQNILNNKTLTPQEILDTLLNKYQSQVMMTVFNNLKTKDNPSKYSSQILLKLRELKYYKLDDVVRNYLDAMGNTELTSEKYEEFEGHILDELDEIIQKFESVDSVIQVIDERNNKFHNSALAVLNYVMNSRKDIEGQIIKALRALKSVDELEDFSDILQINYSSTLDDNSLQAPKTVKKKNKPIAISTPQIDEKALKEKFNSLFGENEFSKNNINNFVLSLRDSDIYGQIDGYYERYHYTTAEIKKKLDDDKKCCEDLVIRIRSLMQDYIKDYEFDAVAEIDSLDAFLFEFNTVVNRDLVQYNVQLEIAKQNAIKRFQNSYIAEIRKRIRDEKTNINNLNKILADKPFGVNEERYHFEINRSQDKSFADLYDIFISNEDFETNDLFTDQLSDKSYALMEEVFKRLTSDSTDSKQAELVKKYTDYRSFMSYDVRITNKNDEILYLSQNLNGNSGGEKQTPFYIIIAASFDKIIHGGYGQKSSAGIVIFDEAFNNMDGARIDSMLKYFAELNIQPIISVPDPRAKDIMPYVDTTIGLVKKRDCIFSRPAIKRK